MSEINKNLGHATAYGYAKSKGYEGTEEEFAELMADYASVAESAAQSAADAAQSATDAETSETNAASSASDAAQSALSASASATSASTSATTATGAAGTATTAAQTATTKASEASQSATNAATSAATANSAADDATAAKTAAQSAQSAAETAETNAETAAASVSASAAQIETNTEDISDLKDATHQLSDGLNTFITYSRFEHYALTANATFNTSATNRVSCVVPFTLTESIKVSASSGFRWGYFPWTNGVAGAWSGWFTSINTLLPAGTYTIQIARVTEISEVADVVYFLEQVTFDSALTDAIKFTKNTGDFDVTELFVLENLALSTSGWSYSTGVNRVGTKEGITIPLEIGDVVGLTNYANARFYLGWKNPQGEYKIKGWNTSDVEITEKGDYVVTIANTTDTAQTSKDALASLFFYPVKTLESIQDNTLSINKQNALLLDLNNGYLTATGGIGSQTDDKELYSQKFACEYGQQFIIDLSYGSAKNLWFAYCLYDADMKHIIRTAYSTPSGIIDLYKQITVGEVNAKYIAFSFKSYASYKINIYTDTNISVFSHLNALQTAQDVALYNSVNDNVKSINHRGYNSIAPENTIPAFILSKRKGFTYVETDVQFTSDNVAVCIHDSTIDRTSNGSGNVADMDYDTISTYDFGSWKSAAYAGTQIPTFDQFLTLCKNIGLKPYIELKTGTQAQIEGLVDAVIQYGMLEQSAWISFNSTLLNYVKSYEPTARIGFVASTIDASAISVAQALSTGSNKVFILSASSNITDAIVTLCINAKLPLEVYGIGSASDATSMKTYVTGAIADKVIAGYELYFASIS